VEGYRDGHEPFPERRHISVLGLSVLLTHFDAYLAAADHAEREMAAWEDTRRAAQRTRTEEILTDLLARYGR
jgi:hypothetical protein